MSDLPDNPTLKRALQSAQDWWVHMGIDVPPPPPAQKRPARAKNPQKPTPPSQNVQTAPALDIEKLKERVAAAPSLDALKTVIDGLDVGALSDHARNTVFARGNPEAKIMVIGEAPGREEDVKGLPFVGQAGQLLDKMLAAIGLDETHVYITNICNWRPPGNRNPSPEEIAFCRPLIWRHMELMAPEMIVIVGGVALDALCGLSGIMKTRGQWQELDIGGQNIPAMPIYHPAFLLRRPELKKQAWLDLLAIRARL